MQCKPLILAAAGALLATQALAAVDPYAQPNDSWISINGTVDSVSADRFTLDYGEGSLIVEMDDGDRDADGYKLIPGDKVNVIGKIDDDLFELTTLEASSVYVEKLGTTFYASPLDEEDVVITVTTPIVMTETLVRGTVDSIGDQQFTVNTGARKLTVTTDTLSYDPLDDEGYLKVDKGDRVSVIGEMNPSFFGDATLAADAILVLRANGSMNDADKQMSETGSNEQAAAQSGQPKDSGTEKPAG